MEFHYEYSGPGHSWYFYQAMAWDEKAEEELIEFLLQALGSFEELSK